MRDPMPVTILDCGHVAVEDDRCETTDCPNFRGVIDASWDYRLPSQYLG